MKSGDQKNQELECFASHVNHQIEDAVNRLASLRWAWKTINEKLRESEYCEDSFRAFSEDILNYAVNDLEHMLTDFEAMRASIANPHRIDAA